MTRKIFRWTFGLPLAIGGAGGFLLALFTQPEWAILAAIAMAAGVALLAPHEFENVALRGDDDELANGLFTRPGTPAWYIRDADPSIPGTSAWYHDQFVKR